MMDCEVKEYFSILLEACHVEEISLDVAYRQLRELLERFCAVHRCPTAACR